MVITMISFPIKPMLLKAAYEPFDSPDYYFEWKVDGIRCILFYEQGKTRLQSKTGKDCTRQFPELWEPQLSAGQAFLDGEITVFVEGKPDFEGVMERYHAGEKKINFLSSQKPAIYIVWDVLWLHEKSTMNLPLSERKEILEAILGEDKSVRKIDFVDTDGLALWDAVIDHGLEGMVAKRKDSRYIPGKRTASWLKIKNYQEIAVNVLGYSKKDGGILVGSKDRVQGHAIGMGPKEKIVLRDILETYGTEKNSYIILPPGVRGRIKFTTWTPHGNMRDCSWVRFEI